MAGWEGCSARRRHFNKLFCSPGVSAPRRGGGGADGAARPAAIPQLVDAAGEAEPDNSVEVDARCRCARVDRVRAGGLSAIDLSPADRALNRAVCSVRLE